ncbi:14037_t:CDS:2, partial [Dentiscutata erythropus]
NGGKSQFKFFFNHDNTFRISIKDLESTSINQAREFIKDFSELDNLIRFKQLVENLEIELPKELLIKSFKLLSDASAFEYHSENIMIRLEIHLQTWMATLERVYYYPVVLTFIRISPKATEAALGNTSGALGIAKILLSLAQAFKFKYPITYCQNEILEFMNLWTKKEPTAPPNSLWFGILDLAQHLSQKTTQESLSTTSQQILEKIIHDVDQKLQLNLKFMKQLNVTEGLYVKLEQSGYFDKLFQEYKISKYKIYMAEDDLFLKFSKNKIFQNSMLSKLPHQFFQKIQPKLMLPAFSMAAKAELQEDYATVIMWLTQVLQLHPKSYSIRCRRAFASYKLKMYSKAKDDLDVAIQLRLLKSLGYIYRSLIFRQLIVYS